ncbi:MAG: cell division protein FtsA, partial [Bacteroidales bacterium]|nr:cell division protein FtsA [Bacteroidales bacterium]
MDNSLIAAIDIGTTKIVVLSGTKNSEGKFEILGFGTVASKGIRRGAVLNIEEAIESIKRALEIATQDSGQVLNEVYVGIAGQHIRSIKTKTSTTFSSSETEI